MSVFETSKRFRDDQRRELEGERTISFGERSTKMNEIRALEMFDCEERRRLIFTNFDQRRQVRMREARSYFCFVE